MFFKDRAHAGQLLAQSIIEMGKDFTGFGIVGLARGGVVVGAQIADQLELPLFSLLVDDQRTTEAVYFVSGLGQLIRYPFNKDEKSTYYPNVEGIEDPTLLAFVADVQQRHDRYNSNSAIVFPSRILLIDDGLVSGSTVFAAMEFLRAAGVQEIIVCIPVLPSWFTDHSWDFEYISWRQSTMRKPSSGIFYQRGGFDDTSDEDVIDLIQRFGDRS